jgi:hypothetical protein
MRPRAVTETFDLREDEPDPMRLLPAPAEFIQDRRVDQLLSRDEPFQVEAVRWRFRKRHSRTAFAAARGRVPPPYGYGRKGRYFRFCLMPNASP